MSATPRKQIQELVALYSLEESIFDVFVEGDCDKKIVNWFLESSAIKRDWSVYAIDAIDVPGDTVREWGFIPGNRNEVVVLCFEFAKRGDFSQQVVGVIDSDYDLILKSPLTHPLILHTDYTCIEMYYVAEKTLDKMLGIAFNGLCSSSDLINQITHPLQTLFLIRLTSLTLELNLEELPIDSYIKQNGGVVFNAHGYIQSYLLQNYALDRLDDFMSTFEKNKCLLTGDIRNQCVGTDFIKLVSIYLSKYVGGGHCNKERVRPSAISTLLTCCLEYNDLASTGLFSSLLQRMLAK
jgi:hypothetical protein